MTILTSRSLMALNVETFKDTSGISSPEKLEQRIRDSSRNSGTSFVGTVPLGYYVLPLIERACCLRTPG